MQNPCELLNCTQFTTSEVECYDLAVCMQTPPYDGRQGTGGFPPSIVPSPFLCGSSNLGGTGRNCLEADTAVLALPYAGASGLVDSRRTSVQSAIVHTGLLELVPPCPPRASAKDATQAGPGYGAEPSVSTGAGLVRAVSVLGTGGGSWGRESAYIRCVVKVLHARLSALRPPCMQSGWPCCPVNRRGYSTNDSRRPCRAFQHWNATAGDAWRRPATDAPRLPPLRAEDVLIQRDASGQRVLLGAGSRAEVNALASG